jgi:hypothetical protein
MIYTEEQVYGQRTYTERLNAEYEIGDKVRIGPAYIGPNQYENDMVTELAGTVIGRDDWDYLIEFNHSCDEAWIWVTRLTKVQS